MWCNPLEHQKVKGEAMWCNPLEHQKVKGEAMWCNPLEHKRSRVTNTSARVATCSGSHYSIIRTLVMIITSSTSYEDQGSKG
jgi:hypothetical protein